MSRHGWLNVILLVDVGALLVDEGRSILLTRGGLLLDIALVFGALICSLLHQAWLLLASQRLGESVGDDLFMKLL